MSYENEQNFPPEKWVNTALRGNNEVEVANYEIITKWILQHRKRQKETTTKNNNNALQECPGLTISEKEKEKRAMRSKSNSD